MRRRFDSLRQRLHQFVSSSIVSENIYIRNEFHCQMVSSLHQLQLIFIELFAFRQFHRLIAHNLFERISTTSKTSTEDAIDLMLEHQGFYYNKLCFSTCFTSHSPFSFLTSPFSPAFCDFDC